MRGNSKRIPKLNVKKTVIVEDMEEDIVSPPSSKNVKN
jgi:hypothetical protein